MQHLALAADDLVDRLDHVHRNTDGAGLVGDRPCDGLADPPGRIGREFIAAAIFELIDGLHQADIALLDEIQELQAAIGVFLGDGDHEAEVCLDHFLLGDASFAFALLDALNDLAEIIDRDADFLGNGRDLVADFFDLLGLAFEEVFPLLLGLGDIERRFLPVRIELIAEIALEEFLARHALGVSQAHQLAFKAHQFLVDGVELLNKRFDPRIVDVHRLQIVDDGLSERVVIVARIGRQRLAGHPALNEPFLKLAVLAKGEGNLVELAKNAVAKLGLHGRHRHGLAFFLVFAFFAGEAFFGCLVLALAGLGFFFFLGLLARFRRRVFGAIGCFKVDQVAQKDALIHELIAPDHHGFECQRALAEAADHRIAASLDTLGNRDFAFTGQKLNGPHLTQVHADRVIGAVRTAGIALLDDSAAGACLRDGRALGACFGFFFVLDDLNAHFRQRGHRVLDLVGRELFRRQDVIQLLMRDIAFRLCLLDEFLDLGIIQIENRTVFGLDLTALIVTLLGFRHLTLPPVAVSQQRHSICFYDRSVLIDLFRRLIETRHPCLTFRNLMTTAPPVLR